MIWKSDKASLSTWSNINGIVFWWTEEQELWFENDNSPAFSQVWWGALCSHLSFQGLKYWGHIQVLVTARRLIILNNCPLRRSMRDLSSTCWPTKDHPMLMSAPGSYYWTLAGTRIHIYTILYLPIPTHLNCNMISVNIMNMMIWYDQNHIWYTMWYDITEAIPTHLICTGKVH